MIYERTDINSHASELVNWCSAWLKQWSLQHDAQKVMLLAPPGGARTLTDVSPDIGCPAPPTGLLLFLPSSEHFRLFFFLFFFFLLLFLFLLFFLDWDSCSCLLLISETVVFSTVSPM